jgi:hypothetical protein
MVTQACYPSYFLGGDLVWIEASQGKLLARSISTIKLGIVAHNCNPSYAGDIGRRIVV